MPIVIKMNNDKSLQMSKVTNIYQSENNADDFLILLPQLYESNNIRECTVTFNWKNINGEGNSTLLMFGEDLYKDTFLQATEPLTIMYTSVVGKIEIWLSVTNPSNELVLKTGSTFVNINSTNDIDGELSEQDLLILDDYLLQIQQLKDETTLKLNSARLKSDPIYKIDLDAELQNTINNINPPDIGDGNYVIIQGADIDDSTPSFAKVYSSQTTENKISNTVDSAISGLSGFSDENFTLEEKEKLSTIEPNANFFELTEVDANIVAENTEKNFVSVSEKSMFADKYTKSEIDNLLSSIVTGLVWKDSTGIIMFDDIVTKYPTPEPDWCVNTENEGTWLFNGDVWIKINNDKTPLSTEEVNGLMTWLDKKKLNSIEDGANKYNHPLNHSADMITTNSTRNFVTSAQLEIINNITTTINNAISNYRLKSTKIIESDLDSTLLAKIEVGGSGGVINDNITSISQTYSSFMINNKLNGLGNALSDELLAVSNDLKEIDNGKVDKVIGKELIETTKITKLDGVDNNAQVNVIENIKVNGTSLTPSNKSVDIDIPSIIAGDNVTLVEDNINNTITINANSGSNVTDSEVNGNIIVDGNEVVVYELPSDVAKTTDIPNVNNKLEAVNIKEGTNVIVSVNGNDVTINSTATGGSVVTDSETNGNITIDGVETSVYTIPSDVVVDADLLEYAKTTDIPNVSTKLEATNIKAGTNVTLSVNGNDVTINSTASGTGGSTVTDSATNGNIVVDGSEVVVYTLPSDVARTSDIPDIPDVSAKLEIGNLIQGDNITLSTDGNNVTISANVNDSANVEGSTTNGNILVDGNEVEVYEHPLTHNANIIVQDADNRFVSDTEKATWEDKYTKSEVDNKLSMIETNIDWKKSVATYSDIATIYTNPQDGWTVVTNDTDYTYRYNGTEWIAISANSIPIATSEVDGIISSADKGKLDGIENGANAYSLPTASASLIGGVKGGGNISIGVDGTLNAPTTGDMMASVYDAQGKATDIFDYVDSVIDNVTFDVATTTTDGLMSKEDKVQVNKIAEMEESLADYSSYASVKENDIYTVVDFKRSDTTLYLKSTLSNADANGYYQTCTLNYYDSLGTTIVKTVVWSLAYDADGLILDKVVA